MSLESTLCRAEQAVDNDDWPTARALVRDAFREAGEVLGNALLLVESMGPRTRMTIACGEDPSRFVEDHMKDLQCYVETGNEEMALRKAISLRKDVGNALTNLAILASHIPPMDETP